MIFAYARVSRNKQETALQLDAFARAGIDNVSQEKARSRGKRPVLQDLLCRLTTGDELVVYKVDRIARSIRDLSNIIDTAHSTGAAFRSLTEPFDTRTPAGRMMMQMLGVFAEFEWHMIRERSIAGLEAAASRGVRIGRPRALTVEQEAEVYAKINSGISATSLGQEYGVHLSCIKRVVWRIEQPTRPAVARRFA